MTLKIKLCFVVETTFKMTDYLQDVQDNMADVLDYVCRTNPDADIEVAAVYYRDYNDADRICSTFFTTPEKFLSHDPNLVEESKVFWWSENDAADVALGLNEVRNVGDWSDADVKLLYHYGVSPAHGRQFHGPGISDLFPEGCKMGLDLLALVRRFTEESFTYTFFRITPAVDLMLALFREVYSTGPGKFIIEPLDLTPSYISEQELEEE